VALCHITDRICYPIRTLTLERSTTGSLGFSIVGGYSWQDIAIDGSSSLIVPVFVKSVLPNGPASKDGRLRRARLNSQTLDFIYTYFILELGNCPYACLQRRCWCGR